MCIVVAKYFKDTGWVLAKNRDQNYVSKLSFEDRKDPKVGEVLTMYDHDTGYQEGMNHEGMVIITTSLAPTIADETDREDGEKILRALKLPSQEEAANFFIKNKMCGYIFIATKEKLMLIEAAKMDHGEGDYKAKLRVIPKSETIVRTNHGIDYPWAGFQFGYTAREDIWRQSSEKRKAYAEQAVKSAKSAKDMLEALATKMDKNLQMNLFRVEYKPGQMRTIFQWALIPSQGIAIIRPVQVKMKLKISHDKLQVEVLDNEILKKTFDGAVKHFSRIKLEKDQEYLRTVQTENYLLFNQYISDHI
jgi:hypothetical protein